MVKKNYNMIDCSDNRLPENFDFITPNSVVVLDDLMLDTLSSTAVTQLFIRGAHHIPCFVINTQHNLFPRGKETRNRHLNTQYYVLFRNSGGDHGQIKYLARQLYPEPLGFLEKCYKDATQKPHGYLLLDSHQQTPEILRVRAQILPSEKPLVAYVNKQLHRELALSRNLHIRAPA
jgi:hypothetical protein